MTIYANNTLYTNMLKDTRRNTSTKTILISFSFYAFLHFLNYLEDTWNINNLSIPYSHLSDSRKYLKPLDPNNWQCPLSNCSKKDQRKTNQKKRKKERKKKRTERVRDPSRSILLLSSHTLIDNIPTSNAKKNNTPKTIDDPFNFSSLFEWLAICAVVVGRLAKKDNLVN